MSDGSAHEPLRPLSFNLDPAFAEQRAALESDLHRVHTRLSELRLPPAKRILGQRLQLLYTDLRVLFLKGSLTAEAVEPLAMLVTEFHELLNRRESLLGDANLINTRLDSISLQVGIGMCSLSPRSMTSRWPELRNDADILIQEPLVMPRTEVALAFTFQGLLDIFPVVVSAFPPDFRDTAYHSLQIWTKLQHPCIMPIVAISAEHHDIYVATPFAYKRTLREYIAIDPTVDRLRLLYDLARGMLYLHTENVVYGDLHNANIMMGDDATPIFNFTFAVHESSEHTSDFRAWRQRSSAPSSRYLAPELINDDTRLPTMASDVYAMGCIAYELFSGRAPFEEVLCDTVAEARVLRGLRPTPERKLRSCGEGSRIVRKLITRAWAHEPSQRPTAVTFAEKVKEALDTRGDRDAAESKSLPPIPPDAANDTASSTFEDVNPNEHVARDEAKSVMELALVRQAEQTDPVEGQVVGRNGASDVVHHLLHASFAALAGPVDADSDRRFVTAHGIKATWSITGCTHFAHALRAYGGPHPASVTPRAMLRHGRLPSVFFEFQLMSSLLPFSEPAEGYEFTATVAWTAWRLVEPEQIKGRGRLVFMDSAHVADCSTPSLVAKGFTFDTISLRDGAYRIEHRTFAIQHVAQRAFFIPFSIAPQKGQTRLNNFERSLTFAAWALWPLQRVCNGLRELHTTILAAAALLASTTALVADNGARKVPGAMGMLLAASLLLLQGLGYLLNAGDALRARAAAMKMYEDEIRGAGESASR